MERFPKKDPTPEDRLPADGNPVRPRLQFGLRTLLILQAATAVLLALLLTIDIYGLPIVFVATVVVMAKKIDPRHERAKRHIVDFLAGVLLPVLCLIYDPIVFRGGSELQVFTYVAIWLQIILFIVWQIVSLWPVRWWGILFAGALSIGVLMAVLIGIVILMAVLIGIVSLPLSGTWLVIACLGVLCFTPFLTAYVFLRNARAAIQATGRRGTTFVRLMYLLGAALAVAVPYVVWVLAGDELARLIQTAVPSSWLLPYGFH